MVLKRKIKTKIEIAAEMKLMQERTRQRALVKNVIYPFLLKNSTSIQDAKNTIYATRIALETVFHVKVADEQKRISNEKVSFLKMEDQITGGTEADRDRNFIALFEDETIALTEGLLSGLEQTMESFVREEQTKRPLSSLPAELLD